MKGIISTIERTSPPEALEDAAPFFDLPPFGGRIGARLLRAFESLFGVSVGVHLPGPLSSEPEPIFARALHLLGQLASAGLIDRRHYSQSFPDEPPAHIYTLSKRHGDKRVTGVGVHQLSRGAALLGAIGELVERYSLEAFSPDERMVRNGSASAIRGRALDLSELAGISEERRRAHTHCAMAYEKDTPFRWVRGRSLTEGGAVWVPLQLVSFAHNTLAGAPGGEPLLRPLVSTGAAAHTDRDSALLRGMQEVIERDAFMITWMNGLSPARIDIRAMPNPDIRLYADRLARYGIEAHCLYLPTDFPVHVVLSVLIGRDGRWPAVSVGASARNDLNEALLKALSEAHGCRAWVHMLAEERERGFTVSSALPDQKSRVLWWTAPERTADVQFLLEGPLVTPADVFRLRTLPSRHRLAAAELSTLVEHCRTQNIEACAVDITPVDVHSTTPFRSVMVVVPALQPLHLGMHVPFEDGRRMNELPDVFAYTSRHYPNVVPHPFP